MREAVLSIAIATIAFDFAAASDEEAYYLDPPSPPYCTPFYLAPGCIEFGDFDPPSRELPEARIFALPYSWLETPARLVYTPFAQYLRAEGPVEFEVLVDENGQILSHRIISSPHPLLEQAVIRAIRNFHARPGIAGYHRGRVRFSLEE